jgi:hypothetical protein
MIWGDNVKKLKMKLSHRERERKNYRLQTNLVKIVMLQLSKKEKT